jgi:hypothetical protein
LNNTNEVSLMVYNLCMIAPLHSMSIVGLDTCSGKSISTKRGDFLYLDTSARAQASTSIVGVGGDGAAVGGRGPMVVKMTTTKNETLFMIDPMGVYVENEVDEADFRIYGQQRMKLLGCYIQQCYKGGDTDMLLCKTMDVEISLTTENGILAAKTEMLTDDDRKFLISSNCVDGILNGEGSAMIRGSFDDATSNDTSLLTSTINMIESHAAQLDPSKVSEWKSGNEEFQSSPSLLMNESKLSEVQLSRLYHWRLSHPAPDVPVRMGLVKHVLNEDCYCCDKGKFVTGSYKRNDPQLHWGNDPYWRVYCDGYGGQSSMGENSFEGAVGGFVFSCPSSGTIRRKLYSTSKQFPAILYQFLQEVESEHWVCRELYVDTFAVNLSQAAEDVAAIFQCKIVPISAGSPQELAFAESAVKTIAKMSRTMLISAKHLPGWAWGLADLFATYVHDTLPQRSKGYRSPFEIRHGYKPDLRHLFIKVFGAPCQYSPMGGPEHKRGEMTEWGWYMGMQWPMVLVLTKNKGNVVSVSERK